MSLARCSLSIQQQAIIGRDLTRRLHKGPLRCKAASDRLKRLCENSKMVFSGNEKMLLGPLGAQKDAPYRKCGGHFFEVQEAVRVFTHSLKPGLLTLCRE